MIKKIIQLYVVILGMSISLCAMNNEDAYLSDATENIISAAQSPRSNTPEVDDNLDALQPMIDALFSDGSLAAIANEARQQTGYDPAVGDSLAVFLADLQAKENALNAMTEEQRRLAFDEYINETQGIYRYFHQVQRLYNDNKFMLGAAVSTMVTLPVAYGVGQYAQHYRINVIGMLVVCGLQQLANLLVKHDVRDSILARKDIAQWLKIITMLGIVVGLDASFIKALPSQLPTMTSLILACSLQAPINIYVTAKAAAHTFLGGLLTKIPMSTMTHEIATSLFVMWVMWWADNVQHTSSLTTNSVASLFIMFLVHAYAQRSIMYQPQAE